MARAYTRNIGGELVTLTQEEVVKHAPKLIGVVSVPPDYEPDDVFLVQLALFKKEGSLGDTRKGKRGAPTPAKRPGSSGGMKPQGHV